VGGEMRGPRGRRGSGGVKGETGWRTPALAEERGDGKEELQAVLKGEIQVEEAGKTKARAGYNSGEEEEGEGEGEGEEGEEEKGEQEDEEGEQEDDDIEAHEE